MADSVETQQDERTRSELLSGLDKVRGAPKDAGTLELIVDGGLAGDRWNRGSRSSLKSQLTLMNVRATQLVAGDRSRWALAGDQLYVDMDLSPENIPPGTKLAIGSALIEVSDQPHLGCEKFAARFGQAARDFANSREGTAVNFRGINTRVVRAGTVRVGDAVRKT